MNTPNVTPVKSFLSNHWFEITMFSCFGAALFSVLASVAEHREEVQAISVQNAGCIYLEKSELGAGQHYMICNGQITLKRLQEGETPNPDQALEAAIPAATNAATPTPSAAPTK